MIQPLASGFCREFVGLFGGCWKGWLVWLGSTGLVGMIFRGVLRLVVWVVIGRIPMMWWGVGVG